jgi:hypothetical protein
MVIAAWAVDIRLETALRRNNPRRHQHEHDSKAE